MNATATDEGTPTQKRTWSDSARMRRRFQQDSFNRLKLTRTERKVLQMVGEGMSRPEAAKALYISLKTVEWHLAGCFVKLDAHNIIGAFFEAVRRGECVCPCRKEQ